VTRKRYAILTAVFVLAPAATSEAQTGDIRTELMHCLTFAGAVERLSCYDRLAHGAASGALGAPSGGLAAPSQPLPSRMASPAAPPPPVAQELGREELRGSVPAETAQRLSAEISNFQKDPAGRFTISLNNGQIWQQVAGDTTAAQYHPGRTHSVTISKGSLGSYDLTFNDRNAVFKVRRVQ
jgi:hypothetical protein